MEYSFKRFSFDPGKSVALPLDAISDDRSRPITLRVLYAGNPGFQNALAKLPNGLRGQAGTEAMAALFVDHCLVGWENVEFDGSPVPFSKEEGQKFLSALILPRPNGCPEVFDRILAFVRNAENFRGPIASADPLAGK